MHKIIGVIISLFILFIIGVAVFDQPVVKAVYPATIIGGKAQPGSQVFDGSPGQVSGQSYYLVVVIKASNANKDKSEEIRLENSYSHDLVAKMIGTDVTIEYVETASGLGSLYRLSDASVQALLKYRT